MPKSFGDQKKKGTRKGKNAFSGPLLGKMVGKLGDDAPADSPGNQKGCWGRSGKAGPIPPFRIPLLPATGNPQLDPQRSMVRRVCFRNRRPLGAD